MPYPASRPVGLAAGWLADRALGDPARGHPVAGFGRLATGLEARIWAPSRVRGAGFVAVLVGCATAGTWAAARATRRWPWLDSTLGALVLWTALGGRSLERAGTALATALEAGDLAAARALLPPLAGRDPTGLDCAELCRAGIESVAENTADAVVGPLLWGALGGPAAVGAYRAANTLDAMVGHRSDRYQAFGWAAARLDDLLTWPAARLAAGVAVLVAPLVGGDRGRAWSVLRRDGASHPSPNSGRLEAAFAGALGVRLGGRNVYVGQEECRPYLGDGPVPGPGDLHRAVALSRATGWAAAGLVTAALALVGGRSDRGPGQGGPRVTT